jgi:hypothetical protein
MFEVTGRPFGNRPYQTIKEEIQNRMIDRLRMATSQNCGYNPDSDIKEKQRAIAFWEQWYQGSVQSKSTTTN